MYQVVAQGPLGIAVVDSQTGDVLISRDTGLPGLGAINWERFGNIFQQSWTPIAEGLRDRLSGKYKYGGSGYGSDVAVAQYPGASFQATSGGAFGSIDSTTLMLLGLGAALIFFMKK